MTGPADGGGGRGALTLVISVYNNVRALSLIFDALDRQTIREFDVVIADDGSGPEMAELVRARAAAAPYRVSRVWQPDEGFRKNAALNRAVAAAAEGYLVFIDGDCVPHRRFLEDHRVHAREGAVLCGRRVNLGPELSAGLTSGDVRSGRFERLSARLVADGLRGRTSYVEEALRIETPWLRRLLHPGPPGMVGCNFSVHREWLVRINGFNEEYEAPGLGEDSDVAFRLGLAGARLESLRNLAVLFHLHHPPTAPGERNRRIFDRVVASREMVCRRGLTQRAAPAHAG